MTGPLSVYLEFSFGYSENLAFLFSSYWQFFQSSVITTMVGSVSDFILNLVIIVSRFQKNITNFWWDLKFIDIDMSRFEAVHYVLKI
jgi:hypothetical protein